MVERHTVGSEGQSRPGIIDLDQCGRVDADLRAIIEDQDDLLGRCVLTSLLDDPLESRVDEGQDCPCLILQEDLPGGLLVIEGPSE